MRRISCIDHRISLRSCVLLTASFLGDPKDACWRTRGYLRQNWLFNRVFETYDKIVAAGCQAWNKLTQQPETISSIGMRKWAHNGL